MKSKIILFIALVAIFSSFTFISSVSVGEKTTPVQESNNQGTPGGFAMEDRDSW